MTSGKMVRLFLPAGSADGLLVCDLLNWSGVVLKFRREALGDFLERSESRQAGVYILRGRDHSGAIDQIYIGESDIIGNRLRQHSKSKSKDFWCETYIVASKDHSLTKSHILYLEAALIGNVLASGRIPLTNTKKSAYERLSEADTAYLNSFTDSLIVLLSAIGFDVFLPTPLRPAGVPPTASNCRSPETSLAAASTASASPSAHIVLLDEKSGLTAHARESGGKILVLKGSHASLKVKGLVPHLVDLRAKLLEDGVLGLSKAGDCLEFASTMRAPVPP